MASDAPSNVLDSRPDGTHNHNPVYSGVQCTDYSQFEPNKSYPFGCSRELAPVHNVSTNVETDIPEPKRWKLEAENEGRDDVPSAFPKNEISTRSQYEPMMVDQDLWPEPVFPDTAERELMRRRLEEEDMDIDDDGGENWMNVRDSVLQVQQLQPHCEVGAGDGELCFHMHAHLTVSMPV